MLTLTERREAWIAALESEEFRQGSGKLHHKGAQQVRGTATDFENFCCLGVGCRLAMVQDWGITVTSDEDETSYGEITYTCRLGLGSDESSQHYMPECVWEALGLDGRGANRVRGEPDPADLAIANDDDSLSFKEIAELLRSGDYWIENKKGSSEA